MVLRKFLVFALAVLPTLGADVKKPRKCTLKIARTSTLEAATTSTATSQSNSAVATTNTISTTLGVSESLSSSVASLSTTLTVSLSTTTQTDHSTDTIQTLTSPSAPSSAVPSIIPSTTTAQTETSTSASLADSGTSISDAAASDASSLASTQSSIASVTTEQGTSAASSSTVASSASSADTTSTTNSSPSDGASVSSSSASSTSTTSESSPTITPVAIVKNGGFEDTDTNTWTIKQGQIKAADSSFSGHRGSEHYFLWSSISYVYFTALGQTLPAVKKGYTYKASFWYAQLSPASSFPDKDSLCHIRLEILDQIIYVPLRVTTQTGTWLESPELTFTSYEDAPYLNFYIGCANGAKNGIFAMDDVVIVDTGLPYRNVDPPAPFDPDEYNN